RTWPLHRRTTSCSQGSDRGRRRWDWWPAPARNAGNVGRGGPARAAACDDVVIRHRSDRRTRGGSRCCRLICAPKPQPIAILTLKNRTLSRVAQVFIEELRAVAKEVPAAAKD